MMATRYGGAATFCGGKRVLEVGCGPGAGLGRLAQTARIVVGSDRTEMLLAQAKHTYQNAVPLVRLDALDLPFVTFSFDVIVLFEAIYYLPDVDRFLA